MYKDNIPSLTLTQAIEHAWLATASQAPMLRGGSGRTLNTANQLKRKDDRVILHFDYDCFYAAVFEAENPVLKSLPLAVQQKQIVVTCNYEARRRGLRKLQLITEAKRVCPDAVIVLGEDLTKFRDASKTLYNFLRAFVWSDKAERLGFDEVWLDVTDMIDYNVQMLNQNDLANSFFQLSSTDPTLGFLFDASTYAGSVFPAKTASDRDAELSSDEMLSTRLRLGSHLAFHIRLRMEEEYGYTATVGISTTKLVSKLVGNVNKPKNQTTLVPPYDGTDAETSNVLAFLDPHDIGKIPGIGFKLAQKIREYVLSRPAQFDAGLVYGGTKESINVTQCRHLPGLDVALLDRILAGTGTPHGIGAKVLGLLHGIDSTEVSQARNVPKQISIEDSYLRLDTMKELLAQLHSLSERLITRMRIDLTESLDPPTPAQGGEQVQGLSYDKWKWLAHPPTLRLTTRPRLPLNADGTRQRSFKRISRSTATPSFIFSQTDTTEVLVERLVRESLLPLFRKLHPERSGWNLSLLNVAVTGMADEGKGGAGRDIGAMFKTVPVREEDLLDPESPGDSAMDEDDQIFTTLQDDAEVDAWEDQEDESLEVDDRCPLCGASIPTFARLAHERFHSQGEDFT